MFEQTDAGKLKVVYDFKITKVGLRMTAFNKENETFATYRQQ